MNNNKVMRCDDKKQVHIIVKKTEILFHGTKYINELVELAEKEVVTT